MALNYHIVILLCTAAAKELMIPMMLVILGGKRGKVWKTGGSEMVTHGFESPHCDSTMHCNLKWADDSNDDSDCFASSSYDVPENGWMGELGLKMILALWQQAQKWWPMSVNHHIVTLLCTATAKELMIPMMPVILGNKEKGLKDRRLRGMVTHGFESPHCDSTMHCNLKWADDSNDAMILGEKREVLKDRRLRNGDLWLWITTLWFYYAL